MSRRDYAPTIENIDIGLAQCAELIERYPQMEHLWLFFDRLEEERGKAAGKKDRLARAKARVEGYRQSASR